MAKQPTTKDGTGFGFKSEPMYKVTFGNTEQVFNEEELQDFVKTAVVHNKGVNRFSVERIGASESSESALLKRVVRDVICSIHHPDVKGLLDDSGARAMRIVVLTHELGPAVDAARIARNLKDVIKLLGYE